MIQLKRWLSVLCVMAMIVTSVGGWWSECSVGAATTYVAYVDDYLRGAFYKTNTKNFDTNDKVTVESFFGAAGLDKTPGKIYEGMELASYSQGYVIPLESGSTGKAALSRYFGTADCEVTYTDTVIKGPKKGTLLKKVGRTVPCGRSISASDMTYTYMGYVHVGDTTDDTYKYTAAIERKFEPVTTTVYYNYQGAAGGSVNSEEFYYGSDIKLAKNTSEKNFTVKFHKSAEQGSLVTDTLEVSSAFRGWSEKAGGSVLYSDEASLGTVSGSEHTTKSLYAIWTDETLTLPVLGKREGYQFLGWSANPDAEIGSMYLKVTANTDLYPVWCAEECSWKAEYYREKPEGGYELAESEMHTGMVDGNVSLNAPGDKYAGYVLDTGRSVLSGTVSAKGDLVLKAYYKRNSYSVHYDANGGEGMETGDWPAQQSFGEKFSLPSSDVKRTGYQFGGWSETPEGGGSVLAPGFQFTMPAKDVTLYAVWTPISYEVAFDGNGAGNAEESISNIQAEYGKEFVLPECSYINPGYGFAGWNTKEDGSGLLYEAGTRVKNLRTSKGTVKLYAQWKVGMYHVSYHTNHTGQMLISNANAIPDTEYKYGGEVTASALVYKALGYQMKGWNTKPDGTGISVAPGERISDKIACNADITLYAVWDRNTDTSFGIELYTVSADHTENQVERLTLSGTTEEKICDAVKRIYERELDGEPLSFFYEGYEVANMEEMEKRIAGDGSTTIKLQLKDRRCKLSFKYFEDGQEIELEKVDLGYMEPYILPEKVGGQAGIARYITAKKESCSPGEEIMLRRNKTLYLQQEVKLLGESGQFEDRTEYVIRGRNFALPEITKNGYQFLGWYTQDREYIGMPGQVMQRVMINHTLTARWSEPLHYEVRFDIDEDKIRILENRILEYQYGTVVNLPTKEQVAVLLDGYVFLGWYEDGDENKTLLTSIAAGSFGDKRLKALLVKDTAGGSGSGGSQGGNGTGGNTGNGGQGAGSGTDGSGTGGNTGNGGQGAGSGTDGGNGSGGNTGNGGQNAGSGTDGSGTGGNTGNGGQGAGSGTDGNGTGGNTGNGSQNGGSSSGGNGGQGGNGSGGNSQGGSSSGSNGSQGVGDGSGGNVGNGGQNGGNGQNGADGSHGGNGSGGQNGGSGSDGSIGSNGQNGGSSSSGGNGSNGQNGGSSSSGGNGSDGQNGGSGSSGNIGNGGQNGTGGSNGNIGNGGPDGVNGTGGNGNISGGNGQDGSLEEKPDAGNKLDSLKQHSIRDLNGKLEKFWKNKLRYQMRRGKKGKLLLKVINCKKSLKKVKISASVRRKGRKYKVTRIGKKAFYKKGNVRSVIIGKNIKRVGKLSLANMKRLRYVSLGKNVRNIKAKAFAKDPSIRKLIVRTRKLKHVAKNAFKKTKIKKGIRYPRGKKRAYEAYFPEA